VSTGVRSLIAQQDPDYRAAAVDVGDLGAQRPGTPTSQLPGARICPPPTTGTRGTNWRGETGRFDLLDDAGLSVRVKLVAAWIM
jgi:hypothetical protein